jgi:methylisocitrate lyase
MFQSLRESMAGPSPVLAPLVLNPLMAKLAEQAGFSAGYLGGGAMGYDGVFLEANLTVTEMAQAGAEIAAATSMPIILDGACGWGDPMHLHRTIATAEAAGFAAIEIEDQLFPKRAHHHVGCDHLVPQEAMEAKIRSAVEARRDPDFLIIARTGAAGIGDLDDALRRCEAYRRAGADVLIPVPGGGLVFGGDIPGPGAILRASERLEPPLMFMTPPGGLAHVGLTLDELGTLGYRIVVDGLSLHLNVYETLAAGYRMLAADGFALRGRTPAEW